MLLYFTYQNMCRKKEKKDNRAHMRTMRQTKKEKKDMAYLGMKTGRVSGTGTKTGRNFGYGYGYFICRDGYGYYLDIEPRIRVGYRITNTRSVPENPGSDTGTRFFFFCII
jgi:hypothetical protein